MIVAPLGDRMAVRAAIAAGAGAPQGEPADRPEGAPGGVAASGAEGSPPFTSVGDFLAALFGGRA